MRILAAIPILLLVVSARADDYPQQAQDATIVETVLRLENFDLNTSEKGKSAVLRYSEHNPGSDRFFELLRKYDIAEAGPILVKLAGESYASAVQNRTKSYRKHSTSCQRPFNARTASKPSWRPTAVTSYLHTTRSSNSPRGE